MTDLLLIGVQLLAQLLWIPLGKAAKKGDEL